MINYLFSGHMYSTLGLVVFLIHLITRIGKAQTKPFIIIFFTGC